MKIPNCAFHGICTTIHSFPTIYYNIYMNWLQCERDELPLLNFLQLWINGQEEVPENQISSTYLLWNTIVHEMNDQKPSDENSTEDLVLQFEAEVNIDGYVLCRRYSNLKSLSAKSYQVTLPTIFRNLLSTHLKRKLFWQYVTFLHLMGEAFPSAWIAHKIRATRMTEAGGMSTRKWNTK